jgi:tetratricopeptide (TPR) repeat protein
MKTTKRLFAALLIAMAAVILGAADRQEEAKEYVMRGNLYAERGDYNRAIADFTQAIRLDPNNADAYFGRGYSYANKNDYDRAIGDYNEAIRLKPDDAAAYTNRGSAYAEKGDYDRAIADFTQYIRRIANLVEAANAANNRVLVSTMNYMLVEAYDKRGRAYVFKGSYDRAMADFTESIRLDPNNADAYVYRGGVYYFKNDYARARADFKKALQLNPNHTEARYLLEGLR